MQSTSIYRSAFARYLLGCCVALTATSGVTAQKRYTYNSQVWTSYFTNLRLSKRWAVNVDGSLRTKNDFVHDLSQSIFRVGGSYLINEELRLTAGYVYSMFYANDNHPLSNRVEHRPYQMVQWIAERGHYRFTQVGRVEQRFRQRIVSGAATSSYSFMQRIRFASSISRSLSRAGFGPRRFAVSAGLELFYHVGKEVVNNGFDQLRASANIQYQVNASNTITGGYLYQVQQFSKGDGFNKLNAVRISLIQQLDLRKHKI